MLVVRKNTGKQLTALTKKLLKQKEAGKIVPKASCRSGEVSLLLGHDEARKCDVWVVIDTRRVGEVERHTGLPAGNWVDINHAYTLSEPFSFNHVKRIEYKTTYGTDLCCYSINEIKDADLFELTLRRGFAFFNRNWIYDKYQNCIAMTVSA